MNSEKKSDDKRDRQAAIDSNFFRKQLRSKLQPGLISHDLTDRILDRAQTMISRRPDATALNQDPQTANSFAISPSHLIFKPSMQTSSEQGGDPVFSSETRSPIIQAKILTESAAHQPSEHTPESRPALADALDFAPAPRDLSKKPDGGNTGVHTGHVSKQRVKASVVQREGNTSIAGNHAKADHFSSHPHTGPAIKTIQRSPILKRPATRQPGPTPTTLKDTPLTVSGDTPKGISSLNPGNPEPIPGKRSASDAIIQPEARKQHADVIQQKANPGLGQGPVPERFARAVSEQILSDISGANAALKSSAAAPTAKLARRGSAGQKQGAPPVTDSISSAAASLQPAIRRRGVNRDLQRSLQRMALSNEAPLRKRQRPDPVMEVRGITKPPDCQRSLTTPVAKKSGAAVKALATSAANYSPIDSGTTDHTSRLQRQTHNLADEHTLTRQTAPNHLQIPNASRSDISAPAPPADPGIAIQKRYQPAAAGDLIQKKATPLRALFMAGNKPRPPTRPNVSLISSNKFGVIHRHVQNYPATLAEHRHVPITSETDFPKRSSIGTGLNYYRQHTADSEHDNAPAALISAATSKMLVQTKPGEGSDYTGSVQTSQPQLDLPNASIARTEAKVDVRQLADQVYEIIFQRLASERERKGL